MYKLLVIIVLAAVYLTECRVFQVNENDKISESDPEYISDSAESDNNQDEIDNTTDKIKNDDLVTNKNISRKSGNIQRIAKTKHDVKISDGLGLNIDDLIRNLFRIATRPVDELDSTKTLKKRSIDKINTKRLSKREDNSNVSPTDLENDIVDMKKEMKLAKELKKFKILTKINAKDKLLRESREVRIKKLWQSLNNLHNRNRRGLLHDHHYYKYPGPVYVDSMEYETPPPNYHEDTEDDHSYFYPTPPSVKEEPMTPESKPPDSPPPYPPAMSHDEHEELHDFPYPPSGEYGVPHAELKPPPYKLEKQVDHNNGPIMPNKALLTIAEKHITSWQNEKSKSDGSHLIIEPNKQLLEIAEKHIKEETKEMEDDHPPATSYGVPEIKEMKEEKIQPPATSYGVPEVKLSPSPAEMKPETKQTITPPATSYGVPEKVDTYKPPPPQPHTENSAVFNAKPYDLKSSSYGAPLKSVTTNFLSEMSETRPQLALPDPNKDVFFNFISQTQNGIRSVSNGSRKRKNSQSTSRDKKQASYVLIPKEAFDSLSVSTKKSIGSAFSINIDGKLVSDE